MKSFKEKLVLITGSGSGIGKIMVRLFLERGAKVVIWDIDQTKIDTVISEFLAKGNISGYKVDVSDIEQIKDTAAKVKANLGTVDVLINNAGIIVGKYFNEHSHIEITKTMQINTNAPMYIAKEFIGDMLKQNSGHICNIASSAGIISNPKMSVYVASKWAIVGWSESLRLEMEQLNKNICVTTILPYYINTGMFDGVKSKIPILEPEKAALTIVKAIEEKKNMLTIPGWIYRFTRFGQAIMPFAMFDWFAGKILGIYKTMENFTGRKE